MFVIQRVLETDGKFTLLDKNTVIRPNPHFRLFATTNTIGLGDTTGLYHGTQQINHDLSVEFHDINRSYLLIQSYWL